jgi:hypothetical protein
MPDEWIVSKDGMLLLDQVIDQPVQQETGQEDAEQGTESVGDYRH